MLARCKTPSSLLYGCILTADERLRYIEAVEQSPPEILDQSPCILDVPAVAALMRGVERDHIFTLDRESASLLPIAHQGMFSQDTTLALSPHVIGRILVNGAEHELVLANVVATRAVILSAGLAPLLKYVSKAPRTVGEIGRYAQRTGVPMTAAEWFTTAKHLWYQGYFVSVAPDSSLLIEAASPLNAPALHTA